MHLSHWLHENLNNNPEKSTTDIVVNKFKHLQLAESRNEYMATSDPDVISVVQARLGLEATALARL
jgi:hypothetical protein